MPGTISSTRHRRKFLKKPQWSIDDLYIPPFVSKRVFDERGIIHYVKIDRNTSPSGVRVMDHFLLRMSAGMDRIDMFCKIYGLRTDDIDSMIYIMTGQPGQTFRFAYQLRLLDDLLRYTELPLREVARRSGLGTHTNMCLFLRRQCAQTPTQRRMQLRQPGDAGLFAV